MEKGMDSYTVILQLSECLRLRKQSGGTSTCAKSIKPQCLSTLKTELILPQTVVQFSRTPALHFTEPQSRRTEQIHVKRSSQAQSYLKLAGKKLNARQLVEEGDMVLIHSKSSDVFQWRNLGRSWTAHTGLSWSGQAQNWMAWHSIYVHLFMQCDAHICLLWATEMPSKNYHCQGACQCCDQKRSGVMLTDCSYPQPAPLNSATLDWATQGSRKTCCFVLVWQLACLKKQFRISHLFVTWLNSTLFSRN